METFLRLSKREVCGVGYQFGQKLRQTFGILLLFVAFDMSTLQEEACGAGYQEERVDGECQDINECLTG